MIERIILSLILIHFSNSACPRATFQFRNKTTLAAYNFIDSSIGNIGSLETCPYTGRPYVYLPCYPNSSWGHEPYFSNCFKPIIQIKTILNEHNPYHNLSMEDVSKMPLKNSMDASNILSYLNEDTRSYKSSFDSYIAVNIIERIVQNKHNTENISSNVYSIVDKILSSQSQIERNQRMNGTIVKLLSLMETYSNNLILDELDKSYIKNNFALSIVNKPLNRTEPILGFSFDSLTNETKPISSEQDHENSTYIILDPQALIEQDRLTFSIYDQKIGLFNTKHHQIISPVISLTIDKPDLIENLGPFVKINFLIDNNFPKKNSSIICAYWHIFDNMTAEWSTNGCYLNNLTQYSVSCMCNHLTHFAILMNIEQKSTPKYVEQVFSIITLIGLLLSSTGLCLTILTFLCFKKLRRHFSQKSLLFLSINLLCVNILFSIICVFTLKQYLCIIIASLLHYFILSSFSWLFIMGLIQYFLFVQIFSNSITKAFTRKAAAFSQLVPLIPIIIVLVIDPFNYTKRNDRFCWLSNSPFYFSFILPIVLYICINSIILSIVAYTICCRKRDKHLRTTPAIESQRLSRFSLACSCFIVLSLTWLCALFTIGSIRVIFQILFCIFASLTGFLIFILYIITSKTRRIPWNNTFKTLGISSIYSPTLSSSSGFLASKDYSTPSITDHQKHSFPHQPQHYIDAYMPSSPPPPAPPLVQPPLLIDGDDSLSASNMANQFYEPRHVWAPQTNYIYETSQPSASLDDYSLFYASNHDATKL